MTQIEYDIIMAIFGEKDFQQQLIIKKMTKDLNFPVKIISLPTVRAMDGLALSSRNKYLNPAERVQAVYLYRALKLAAEEIRQGEKSPQKILRQMKSLIAAKTKARLDYLVMVDPETLAEKRKITGQVLIAVAADFGRTRLIDNITI